MKKQLLTLTIALLSLIHFLPANAQTSSDVRSIPLLGDALFPEGILALPDGSLLVGGFGDGTIQKIGNDQQVTYFSKKGENGIAIVVGMAYDKKNDHLWVANFNFRTATGNPGSNLKLFRLSTGKLIKTIPENYIDGVFFNEVAIAQDGQVYVSNTFGPQIYTANANASEATVFVEDPLLSNPAPDQPFDLNGLTITPDGEYLIASVMDRLDAGDGRLVRIGIKDRLSTNINLSGGAAVAAFAGSDGMFFHKGRLFMVNVYSKAGAIITAEFDKNYLNASLKLHPANNTIYDRPTASAILNNRLYTVNSQLNHIIDDADGKLNTPPVLPFKVVSIPLKDLK